MISPPNPDRTPVDVGRLQVSHKARFTAARVSSQLRAARYYLIDLDTPRLSSFERNTYSGVGEATSSADRALGELEQCPCPAAQLSFLHAARLVVNGDPEGLLPARDLERVLKWCKGRQGPNAPKLRDSRS